MLALRRSLQLSCSLRNRAHLSTTTFVRAGDSGKVQDLSAEEKKDPKLAGGLPDEVPKDNKVKGGQSHSMDPLGSKVPHVVQDAVPESVERALPESIHPTEGKKASYKK